MNHKKESLELKESIAGELLKLANLKEKGVLSDEEFLKMKKICQISDLSSSSVYYHLFVNTTDLTGFHGITRCGISCHHNCDMEK